MDTVGRHQYRPARENPSFSSSLLDEIYRSIDERDDQELMVYRKTTREKQSNYSINGCFQNHGDAQQDIAGIGRNCLIEKWMDKEVCEKVVVRRRSAADFKKSSQQREGDSLYFHSSSSSSDSSCGGGFSSSEAESVYGTSSRPKPIHTGTDRHEEYNRRGKQRNTYGQNYQLEVEDLQSKPKHEGKFVKTKSRAMKIYGDLKKVKQPISPGGRLATFLNSLFTNGNTKSTKLASSSTTGYDNARSHMDRKSKSANASTCSSASSFSRSCLSKTPSSRGKLSNNKIRSVRFFPVSVIVDEDCQPCGHKSLYGEESNLQSVKFVKNTITEELKMHSSEKNRRIEEAARNLLRNYQKKVECEFDLIRNSVKSHNEIDMNYEEDDDDDAASHTSSDLFELKNFSAIGMEKYRDELPVYETTHLDTNLAIGNGFLM
ncbi:protein BIG GRAIN 1-like B [Cynara cardunculus var. scolymus]|uniref:Protein BIG GRAIN 1-like B n=1 Tax=Cynara cardunculus var. scolymus TaxID=59895 RepID=A0A103XLF8_CYNCS|nr:protein BIG GRAIN 1-like B [Cynara cardunculus var. scolymus]KVH92896.1 hypothetical protein Ccrd_005032 [Cynara cardunculus var. scolymus]